LLRVHSNSSSRSLMKKLNKTGPSTDPWGTPLVTGLQLDFFPLRREVTGKTHNKKQIKNKKFASNRKNT